MFSSKSRCIYRHNPLAEVICQLRFPEILAIGARPPVDFQEAIRGEFPLYSPKQEVGAPKITGVPGHFSLENRPATVNYQFSSPDGVWRVNLTSKFISLSCSRYTCWEDFAQHLDKPLAAFIQIYKPAHFERVGLRYLNFISRKALALEDVPFSSLIQHCYLGPLAESDVTEQSFARCNIDVETAIRGGGRLKLHAGPGLIKRPGQADNEIKFVFDQDLFMPGNIPVNHSAGTLQTLHSQSYSIFRGAITDVLHEAMEPQPL